MKGVIEWDYSLQRVVANGQYNRHLRDERMGVMLHYDASGSDRTSVAWFADPRCRVSYNLLVLDGGEYVRIAPDSARAWHAGRCRTSDPDRLPYTDANSAFYGIAIASSGKEAVTPVQLFTVVALCRRYFKQHSWSLHQTWRVVSHRTEAINKDGSRGRKTDPEGADLKNPILSAGHVRSLLLNVSTRGEN